MVHVEIELNGTAYTEGYVAMFYHPEMSEKDFEKHVEEFFKNKRENMLSNMKVEVHNNIVFINFDSEISKQIADRLSQLGVPEDTIFIEFIRDKKIVCVRWVDTITLLEVHTIESVLRNMFKEMGLDYTVSGNFCNFNDHEVFRELIEFLKNKGWILVKPVSIPLHWDGTVFSVLASEVDNNKDALLQKLMRLAGGED